MKNLKDTLEKAFYIGMGFASRSKEAIEKAIKKLGEEIELSEEEGKKFAEKLSKDSESARKSLESCLNKAVDKTIDFMGLARKSEVEALKKKLNEYERNEQSKDSEKE